jgi:hypothetical protein
MIQLAARVGMWLAIVLVCCAALPAAADAPSPERRQARVGYSLTVGLLLSHQPPGEGIGGTFTGELEGTEPGLFLSHGIPVGKEALASIEVSTSTPLEACVYDLRFASRCPPREPRRHRDTVVSALFGPRHDSVEFTIGPSVVVGTGDVGGFHPAVTVAFGSPIRVGERMSIVPQMRYTAVLRSTSNDGGLGRHIFRFGVGLRFDLTPGGAPRTP